MWTTVLSAFLLGAPSIALPGEPPVGLDYIAYDGANHRVWVPAGNTGNVDVVDVKSGRVTPVGGFPTAPHPKPGRTNRGPAAVALAERAAWIANRADNKLCAIDRKSLKKQECIQLEKTVDGMAYVPATHELWTTTPIDNTLTVVDVKGKAPFGTIKLDGEPEGHAVDSKRGRFYVSLPDKNTTVAIDVRTRKVAATWPSGCGSSGPRGVAVDGAGRFLFVACADGAVALDLTRNAEVSGRLKTGGGIDTIEYVPARRLLYVASAKDGTLTIARVSDAGALNPVATVPTSSGARNPVVDEDGTAYLTDSSGGRLIVVKLPAP